ncbi:MAG: hypothetical protein II444_04765 [Firmicutes bacterium]|nr:hypothetical protein [Bacillota bacterium]
MSSGSNRIKEGEMEELIRLYVSLWPFWLVIIGMVPLAIMEIKGGKKKC